MTDLAHTHCDTVLDSGFRQIKGYLCQPDGDEARGSVIIIHEIFGVSDHIKDISSRLAAAGYNSLAINYFSREGMPPVKAGLPSLMEFVGRIPDAQVIDDTAAGMRYLRAQPTSNGKVAVIGFCWGGYFAMLSAAEVPTLNAAIAYYGRIRMPANADRTKKPHAPIEVVDQMSAPLLGHFGADDQGIPVGDTDALRTELTSRHKTGEIYVYEGAGHAFNNDTREAYHAEASGLAWERTLAWLGQYVS